MELNVGRIGPWLSDRLFLDGDGRNLSELRLAGADSVWYTRFVSWLFSPSLYSEENRRTIDVASKFFTRAVGEERFARICARYSLNFEAMKEAGSPLLSRDFAKILTGIKVVTIEDMEELIQTAKNHDAPWPPGIDPALRDLLMRTENSEELDAENFVRVYEALKTLLGGEYSLPDFTIPIHGGKPTDRYAQRYFDRFLADRERLSINEKNPNDNFETFVHAFVSQGIHREMDVGLLIPAPKNQEDGHFQFYRVAAKIITGEGHVSYCLVPATKDTDLEPIRFYRGTAVRSYSIDASSTVITDLEANLGERAFQSGQIYESILEEKLPTFEVQAGHSLGSTILQKKLVGDAKIREAYLYNGPGVQQGDMEKFNSRMREEGAEPVKLIIRDTEYDTIPLVGEVHLGFKAPESVEVNYAKYVPPYGANRKWAGYAHTTVWNRENRFYGLEGFTREEIDKQLHREKSEQSRQKTLVKFGPFLAKILLILRDLFRWVFGSRAEEQKGIQIGRFVEGRWTTEHVRPEHICSDRIPISA